MAYHGLEVKAENAGRPFVWAMSRGYLAVDLFFCLSGFVLAYNYGERFRLHWSLRSYADFLWRRIARLFPLYLFRLPIYAAKDFSGLSNRPPSIGLLTFLC
jgi:peptidoglycan/LPS O-acetylase OafA/YrhL